MHFHRKDRFSLQSETQLKTDSPQNDVMCVLVVCEDNGQLEEHDFCSSVMFSGTFAFASNFTEVINLCASFIPIAKEHTSISIIIIVPTYLCIEDNFR